MNEARGLVPTIEIHDEAAILYQRFGEVENMKRLQGILTNDLEKALNLLVSYQRCLRILRSPDPHYPEARQLLTKYKMKGVEPSGEFKVFADGVDITTHPDSIEATAIDEPALARSVAVESESVTLQVGLLEYPEDKEWEHEQGIERAELVTDGEGNVRLKPIGKIQTPEAVTLDPENYTEGDSIDPSTRNWLTEDDDESAN